MAEKTVAVRLKLIHDSYMKAAQEAGKATENIAKADKWRELGKETAGLGDKLTRNVTLPIVGIGVAAAKMSLDFDATFVNMTSLAGTAQSEIAELKDKVLDLAGETGKAPKELADALYFLKSSGLDSAQAMDALTVSAKASAAGMGSTVQIADAVSSAMNAYAKSGLSAAEATDVMVATAREGKAEPAELAAQMGRLLPISSELGITFQDVGAALAALSLSGNDAASASTLLSNIMAKLLKPSQQAMEIMEKVGISLTDVRSMIAEKGLLGTLETLRKSLGDAGFAKFLEDSQAVQGGLALTGENVEKNREIFEALNDSVGATSQAFETWSESMGAKNAKAWGQFQAAMIRLGDTLAPLATDLVGFAAGLIEVFDRLPDPLKRVAAGLVIIAAAVGPLLSVGGRVLQIWAQLAKVWGSAATWAAGGQAMANAMNQGAGAAEGFGSKLGGLQKAAGLAAGAAGIGAVLFAIHEIGKARKAAEIESLTEDFMATGAALDEFTEAADGNKFALSDVYDVFKKLLETNTVAADRFIDAAEAAGIEARFIEGTRLEIEKKAEADKQAAEDAETNSAAVTEGAEAFDEETASINAAVDALAGYSDALKAQFDPLFGIIDAHQGMADARRAVDEATAALTEAEKEHGRSSEEAAEAARELTDAQDGAVRAAFDLEGAQINLAREIQAGNVTLDDAIGWLQQWVASGRITQHEADVMAAKFRMAAGDLKSIPREWNSHLTMTGVAQATGRLGELRRELAYISGKTYTVDVKIVGTSVGVVLPGGAKLRAAGGPVRKNEGYVVGEKGPEWFEPDENGRIIPNHLLGNMAPQSGFGGGGGAVVSVMVDMRGAIISSKADAERWVSDAWNRAASRNMVTVRGRPI